MKKVLVIILVGTLANCANAALSFSGPLTLNVGETVQMSLVFSGGDIVNGYIWVDYPNNSGQLSNPAPASGLESCIILGTSYLPDAFSVSTAPSPSCNPLPSGTILTFDLTTAPCAQIGDTYWLQFFDLSFDIVFSQSITIGGLLGYALEVTSPDGGETLQAGTTHTITWANPGVFGDVKLEYSTNNGAGWTVITASTAANDGQYDWTVPEITSSQCLVRVSDVSDACVNDESDGVFTILPAPTLTVSGPNGGETLMAGDVHSVTWSSSGSISNVKLEYSDDNGLAWDVITASTANDGQYNWTVPEVTSGQCLVRVSDASDAGVNDESDGVFTMYVCLLDSIADFDNSCSVGTFELDTVINDWLRGGSIANIVPPVIVDFNDFSFIAADWLRNGNPFEAGFSEAPEGMVFIPNGEFEMGDHAGGGDADELPLHTVYLDAFYMSKNEITNQQYCDYLNAAAGQIRVASGIVYAFDDSSNSNPYLSTTSASTGDPNYSEYSQIEYSGGPFSVITRDSQSMADHPVVNVSWDGAKAYCDHYGLRLATEAEWEYAARGGTYYYKYPWGTDVINQTLANYNDGTFANPHGLTALPFTSNVGYYDPQGSYGLCDMAGNVYEWCSDWYDSAYYSSSATNNPTGPASGSTRIFRGGTWGFDGTQCRVSYRGSTTDVWGNTLGFRVVMDLN